MGVGCSGEEATTSPDAKSVVYFVSRHLNRKLSGLMWSSLILSNKLGFLSYNFKVVIELIENQSDCAPFSGNFLMSMIEEIIFVSDFSKIEELILL